MKFKMYVITHKKAAIPKLPNYETLVVGASFNRLKETGYIDDNSGDNISLKNKSYCELTGIYWVWKNVKDLDIVGFCHYRRYFRKTALSMSINSYVLNDYIKKIFLKYDILLPRLFHYKNSRKENLSVPSFDDMMAVRSAIEKCCPEYIIDFDNYINGNSYYPYNMFCMRWNDFDAYCTWLFAILSCVEKDYGNPYEGIDPYHARLFGFLSEQLTYVWVNHNIDLNKIKETYIALVGEKNIHSIYHIVSDKIRNLLFKFIYERQ